MLFASLWGVGSPFFLSSRKVNQIKPQTVLQVNMIKIRETLKLKLIDTLMQESQTIASLIIDWLCSTYAKFFAEHYLDLRPRPPPLLSIYPNSTSYPAAEWRRALNPR